MSEQEEDVRSVSITVIYLDKDTGPGASDAGYYWTFDDPENDPDVAYDGPYETEAAAVEAAGKAIEAAYVEAVRRMFGDKE